jgi:hypothetical protein
MDDDIIVTAMPLDHNTAGIATAYGLDGRQVGVRVPVEDFSRLQVVQTEFWGSPAFYPMVTMGKADET